MTPFPTVRGGCNCRLIRYQIIAAPLFVYACHCAECQKSTGSVFAVSATIEFDKVVCISPTRPSLVRFEEGTAAEAQHTKGGSGGQVPTEERATKTPESEGSSGKRRMRALARCPRCQCVLWDAGSWQPGIVNVHVGTLDLPALFEPDLHIFVEGKVPWVALPEGCKQVSGDYEPQEWWPKSSLARLKACEKRWDQARRERELGIRRRGDEGEVIGEESGDRTPTNGRREVTGEYHQADVDQEEEEDVEGESDEDEGAQDGLERALEERLKNLSLKLDQEAAMLRASGDEEQKS